MVARPVGALILMGAMLTAACGPADEPAAEAVDAARTAIVNGEVAPGDPAVVALTVQGQAFCSGTLITPSIVLTAAHCLPPNVQYPVELISVEVGSEMDGTELIDAHAAWAHPAWNDGASYDDVGLLQMKAAAPYEPIDVNTLPVPNGSTLRIVGFGTTGEGFGDSGVKRTGTGTLDGFDSQALWVAAAPSVVCSGDSGGPDLFDQGGKEVVAGIHSRSDCVTGGFSMRVDAYLTEINDFISTHPEPTCDADGLCGVGCAQPDPDCPCADDGLCTAACSNGAQDPDCAEQCGANGMCIQACAIPDPDCNPCTADGNCNATCKADPDCMNDEELDPTEGSESVTVEQGCGISATKRPSSTWAWLALLAAMAAARRRHD